MIVNFTVVLRLHFIEITSRCQTFVITALTRVGGGGRRGCRDRLNRSAPYRQEHELSMPY